MYIDPKSNEKRVVETEEELFPLIVYKEGLDSWDIGIKSYEDMHRVKKENIKELMERYKKMLAFDCQKKASLADGIVKNPDLTELKGR